MKLGVRGQSALEYLMTYGWALVVIVIAVAALVILINPSNIQGDTCDAKLGKFVIQQSSVTADSTTLVLVNQTGQGVANMVFDISGTDGNGAVSITSVSPAPDLMNPNQTESIVIDHGATSLVGTYTLTYALTYDEGSLAALNASAQCRGTI